MIKETIHPVNLKRSRDPKVSVGCPFYGNAGFRVGGQPNYYLENQLSGSWGPCIIKEEPPLEATHITCQVLESQVSFLSFLLLPYKLLL